MISVTDRRDARTRTLAAGALALLLLAACQSTAPLRDAPADGEGRTLHLRGPATSVVNDCYFDGTCTVTVQGVEVTTMSGLRSQPPPVWGQSSGQPQPGQEVEVLCRRTGPRSCTLLGSRDLYLRALP